MDKIKLIALDLGGTLLTDDNKITKESVNAIHYAKSTGIKIAVATAREYSSTKYISSVIENDYGVFSNGSHILDIANLKTLKGSILLTKAVLELIDYTRSKGLYLHINQEFCETSDKLDFFALKHTLLNDTYPPNLKSNINVVSDLRNYVLNNQDIRKLVIVSDSQLDSVIEDIMPILNKYNLFITENNKNLLEKAINRTINYIEIGSHKDNKLTGLLTLLELLRISQDETLVIGDGENDIEMLSSFKNSACMSNGSPKVKRVSGYTTIRDNNDSGVEEAIYHYLR